MTFAQLEDMEAREFVPGFHGKMVHTGQVTVAFWEVEEGAALPEHGHPHQQVTTLLAGEFELTVSGESRRLGPGAVAVIPGNVRHAGKALTPCRIIDVFHPEREDYR
jgi:quercetin dioxygenase-like cupin family protein